MAENLILKTGAGESLRKVIVPSTDESGVQEIRMELERDSSADVLVLIMPGVSCSLSFKVDLLGPGADCRLSGIYLCPADERVNIEVILSHKVSNCTSNQLFKGIVGGTARSDFYGRIIVEPDAQKTEAFQANHSLLLSDTAKVDTKPQLEIYADDVKASHGATVGKLNEEEQFYMRSRGVSLEDARVLQMISFLASVFETVPEGEERDALVEKVEKAVRENF